MFKPKLFPPAVRALRAAAFGAALVAVPMTLVAPALAVQESGSTRIEAHLTDLHAKLHIGADQEEQWKIVAQVMRDNEAAIAPLILQRKTGAGKMSALDDLDSYAQISETHVQGIRNFTKAFTVLYGVMSESQKSDADALFRNGIPTMAKAK